MRNVMRRVAAAEDRMIQTMDRAIRERRLVVTEIVPTTDRPTAVILTFTPRRVTATVTANNGPDRRPFGFRMRATH